MAAAASRPPLAKHEFAGWCRRLRISRNRPDHKLEAIGLRLRRLSIVPHGVRTLGGLASGMLRKSALAEPWEMASLVQGALKTERLDRFALNMRDCFINRIGRVHQP